MLKSKTIFILATLVGVAFPSLGATPNSISGQVVIRDAAGSPLSDLSKVVVFIEGKGLEKFKPKATHFSMASRKKRFMPKVVPLMAGSTVEFPNDDKIFHNAFSLSKTKPFDLGLYKKGAAGKTVKFDKTGLVKVYCNIHQNMSGYIVVLDNPFYAVTDKNGHFNISGLPDGDYTVSAWHYHGDHQKKKISVAGGELKVDFKLAKGKEIKFSLTEKETQKHKNKWGKPYKAKY